jgi:DNA-binding Lrp family transcriptional regulator
MQKVSEVTTEQIREASSKGFVASLGYKSVSDVQFDLWFATERNRVAELAQQKLIDKIKAVRDREYTRLAGDYEYFYGVNALLEELGENNV